MSEQCLEIIREEASVSGATAALCSHLLDRYPSADAARAEVKNRLNDILRLLDLTLRHLGSCEAWTGSIKDTLSKTIVNVGCGDIGDRG